MTENIVKVETYIEHTSGYYWFFKISELVFLICTVIGVIYGTLTANSTLQYLGIISLLLAIYSRVETRHMERV